MSSYIIHLLLVLMKSVKDINDSNTRLSVLDVVKGINIKVFNLMWRVNETRYISWNQSCKCKYRLDYNVCNDSQRWNSGKCRCNLSQ